MAQWNIGKSLSKETKQKMSNAHLRRKAELGYINSPEARRKISIARSGKALSKEHKEKIQKAHLGMKMPLRSIEHREKISNNMKNKYVSQETRRKIGEASKKRKGNFSPNLLLKMSLRTRDEKNPAWKGGSWSYWKKQARKRDNETCQICFLYDPEIMEVDHISPKSTYPELSLVLSNLMTICPNCHVRKTRKERKEKAYGRKSTSLSTGLSN